MLHIVLGILSIILLGVMFHLRAMHNLNNYTSGPNLTSNFFTFWLPGHMILNGENPYDATQYLAGHDAYHIVWRPNKIFPYPLPLSLFMVPLGWFPLLIAYYIWQIITQIIIAITVFILLGLWGQEAQTRMLVPMMIFFLFFGPIYLALQVGSIGAFSLLTVLVSLMLFEKQKLFAAGMVLSLTILKPPMGITILFLAGIWLLARRDWRAIQGMIFGCLGILLVGMIQDPLWVMKFREASQSVMDRTQGIQSNVWSYSYLICSGSSLCSIILGSLSSLMLLGLGGFFLWRNCAQLSVWEAFNVIIPIGFVATIYLWSYDQILYAIPVIWITCTLIDRKKSYIQAFLFLIIFEIIAFVALVKHANTQRDLWNAGNTIIVLGMVLWLYFSRQDKSIENISTALLERN